LEVIEKCKKDEVELFTVIARKIRLQRKIVVSSGSFSHPTQILREAETALEDFKKTNISTRLNQVESHSIEDEKWVPPLPNLGKINWDAAVDIINKTIGLSIIARDEKGKFIAACNKRQHIGVEPMVAEAITIIQAILFY
jgi:hypothetical protein